MDDSIQADRRKFLKTGGAAAAAASLPIASYAQVAGQSEIKVALVGCGGRGTGAVSQTLNVEGCKLMAVADAFPDKAKGVIANVKERFKEKVDVPEDRIYAGWDAYKKAIEHCDMVILTTPPGFRPEMFEYAVSKGKHVFMEKPVATDPSGIRRVIAAAKEADAKKLKVVCGLQRRYDKKYTSTFQEVKEGRIGRVLGSQVYWNGGGVWVRPRKENQTEMEYQMRNWYYFNWLCGDHITEQHVHNIDVANWFMGSHPEVAQGMGGRQQRIGPEFGEIFDHHYVEFVHANDGYTNSQCRHQRGCMSRVTEVIIGEKGRAYPGKITDNDGKETWKFKEKAKNAYQVEHDELHRHIREDIAINNAYYTAESTMTSIFGRMATYSGKQLKWDDAINSEISIMPKNYAWDADPGPKMDPETGLYPCPQPGVTKVI